MTLVFSGYCFAAGGSVGAGNATCKNWQEADEVTQVKIVSWMQGFATATSWSRPKELRLELLTSEYLSFKVKKYCSDAKNNEEHMIGVILEVLKGFPIEP